MKLVQAKPSRLHCSACDETFNLPQNGSIKLYKEIKCPLDDFELVLWTTGSKGKVGTYHWSPASSLFTSTPILAETLLNFSSVP